MIRSFALILMVTSLAVCSFGQTQAELRQMIAQLQTTPSDAALRERIIKLAPTVKPAPVISDEAIRFEGRGQAAFADAKSEADYVAAAKEYEKAVAADPWVQPYYKYLCTIYEKAGKFEDAKRHCGFYLLGLTDPTQIIEVKRRIAGLEFRIEKAVTENAEAAKQAAAKKADDDRIAKAEEVKRKAEQAKRDVITKIKNAVNNRSYKWCDISYRGGNSDFFLGVNDNDLFGDGTWYSWTRGGDVEIF